MPMPRGVTRRKDPLTGGEWLKVDNRLGLRDTFTDRETGKTYSKIKGWAPTLGTSGYRCVNDGGEAKRKAAAEKASWDRHVRNVHNRFR
jgi:hypothetical protein